MPRLAQPDEAGEGKKRPSGLWAGPFAEVANPLMVGVAGLGKERERRAVPLFDERCDHLDTLVVKLLLGCLDELQSQTLSAIGGIDGEAVEPTFAAVVGNDNDPDEVFSLGQSQDRLDAAGKLIGKGVLAVAAVRPDGEAGSLPEGHDARVVGRCEMNEVHGVPFSGRLADVEGGDAVFVYNTSSPRGDGEGYVDIGVAAVGDGQVERFEEVKAGENDYDYVDPDEDDEGTQTLRWGDYNGAVPDPSGDGFWVVSQYAKQVDLSGEFDEEFFEDNFYGTRIAKVNHSGG